MRNAFLAAAFLGALLARGENLTAASGRVYFDMVLLTNRFDPAGITFSHRSGIARLDFKDLSEADRARFGHDPAALAAFRKEQAEKAARTPPPTPAAENPPPPPDAPFAFPPSAPDTNTPRPREEIRVVRRTVTYPGTVRAHDPFTNSPFTTIEPDHQKMYETRIKIYQKAP